MTLPLYVQNGKITTGIGSLPYIIPRRAVNHVMNNYDIPYPPELFNLRESMFEYIKNPDGLICSSLFKEEVKKRNISTVKIQVTGRVTLENCALRENRAIEDLVPNIPTYVNNCLDGLVAPEVIVFIDEPELSKKEDIPVFRDFWST